MSAPALSKEIENIAFGSDVAAMKDLIDKGTFPFEAQHWWSKSPPVFVALQESNFDCFKLLAAQGGYALRNGVFKKSILTQAMEVARSRLATQKGLDDPKGVALLDALRFIIPLGQSPVDDENREAALLELVNGHASSFAQSVLTRELFPYVSTAVCEKATMTYLQSGTKQTRDPAFQIFLADFCRVQQPWPCRVYDSSNQVSTPHELTPFQFLIESKQLQALDAMGMAHPRPQEAKDDLIKAGLISQTRLFPRFLERLAQLERDELARALDADSEDSSASLKAFARASLRPPPASAAPRSAARRI